VRLDVLTLQQLDARFINLARPDDLPLHFELEELRVAGLELRGDQITVASVRLRAPSLRVLRDIDLSFVADVADEAGAAQEIEASAAAAPVAPLNLSLSEVDVEMGRFLLVTRDGEVATRLAVHAEGVTLDRDARFPIRASLGIEEGEIVLEGETGAFPPVFAGTLTWQALPLATISSVAGALSPILIDSGKSSGELRIDTRVSDEAPSQVVVSGRLGVDDLALRDREGALTLGWSGLEIGLEELALDPSGERPPRVALSQVTLRAPRANVVLKAGEVPTEPPTGTVPAASQPGPQPELSIASLEVSGGELEFVDETVKPVHTSRISEMQVKGEDLRWPAQKAKSLAVSFSGPADARFALHAAFDGNAGRAHLELSRLGLPAFSPYAADAAGYWLEEGVLSVEADIEVDGQRTKLDSDLDLQDLSVSEVEQGSFEKDFGVPIGLGLALLRDPSGSIDIPIRATLGEDGASVGVTVILVAALRQAIIGALTAPLKTAGLLLGGDDGPSGMQLEPIPMAAGSAEPSEKDLEAAVRFAGVLEARPGLALELRGSVSPEDDPLLAEAILQEQVVADAKLPPVDAGFLQRRRLRGALEDRAEGGDGELGREDREALERWVDSVEVPDERREQLANARAEAVRDALVRKHRVDADRVQLGEPTEGVAGVIVGLAPADH
jgi:hypothetical protein